MMLYWLIGTLLFVASIPKGSCGTACWDFNGGFATSGMYNDPPTSIGPFLWKASVDEYPDISNLPSFYELDAGFAWFQDQATPPVQGSMASTNTLTLTMGDYISINIWRNIIDGQHNDSSRPIIRFYSNGGTVVSNILYATEYDRWDTYHVTCSTSDDIAHNQAICCGSASTTSCTGYFQIDGTAYIRDELLVIDDLDLNGGCSGSTPSPTESTTSPTTRPTQSTSPTSASTAQPTTSGPPGPDNCCHFEDDAMCDWSLVDNNDCWHWSGYLTPYNPVVVPNFAGNYIWVMDTNALVASNVLTGVTSSTIFSFEYYLITSSGDPQEVYFAKSDTDYQLLGTFNGQNNWQSYSVTCGSCCGSGVSSCSGQIVVHSVTKPGEHLFLAIDEFSTNNACGDTPSNWCCDFNADPLCNWNLFYNTIGWHWSGDLVPRIVPPTHDGGYIWAEDETTTVISSNLFDITSTTFFTLDYFFETANPASSDLIFLFKPSGPSLPVVTLGKATVYNTWDTVTLSCTTACCPSGKCAGYFLAETTNAPTNTDVAAIDNFSVNNACGGATPPTPTTSCCSFDTDLCNWSPHYITNGWLWSYDYKPVLPVPASAGYYIFAEDVSADATSPELTDITVGTKFAISYYFQTPTSDANNYVEVGFTNSFGFTVLFPTRPSLTSSWTIFSISCGTTGSSTDCCKGGSSTCSGMFFFRTHNSPGVDLVAAIDNFSLNDGVCMSMH